MENHFSNTSFKNQYDSELHVISIITVVYNAETLLERTFQSIQSQSYPNIEHIVIDGGSKDSSLTIIKKYQSKISYWVSEKDDGIYDAMNKGLAMASGDYVLFLNAGDTLCERDTLTNVFQNKTSDVYYGDTMIVDLQGKALGKRRLPLPEKLSWESLGMGMVVCHQSLIVKRAICEPYKTQFRISADIDWTISCLKKAKSICNTQQFISNFLEGGMSNTHMRQGLQERYVILNLHFGYLQNFWNHLKIGVRLIQFKLGKG